MILGRLMKMGRRKDGTERRPRKFFELVLMVGKKTKKFVFLLLLIGLVVGVTLTEEINVQSKSVVSFFDVGQGDAVLVRSKQGVTILIDGGPTSKIVEHLDSALPFRDREIDYMITTHPHADHLAGLVNVLERFPVRNVIMTGVVHTTDAYLEFLNLVKEKKCSSARGESPVGAGREPPLQQTKQDNCIHIIVANKKKTIQDQDVTIELLWPQESFEGKKITDKTEDTEGGLNDTSVISRITLDGVTFLFPGDASVNIEEKLLGQKENLKADVLLLAHHGSKTSNSENFLKALDPKYAVISVGAKNRYGLPAYLIVRRVERLGIPIYRTDQEGTIEFLVEDGRIDIKTER